MKRNKHSLSHYKLLTCDMGKLIPVGVYEVLPGDTVQQASSALIRVSPLVAPVMHPVSVRIHHWFVPNRLVWDGWEDFITGGPDGIGGDAGAYPAIPGGNSSAKDVLDYMGVPPLTDLGRCSALPVRAYNLIFNEHYRDQDLVPERLPEDLTLATVAWEKDYFTTARPWPQKGPDVSMPLGVTAPVVPDPANAPLMTGSGFSTPLPMEVNQTHLVFSQQGLGAGNPLSFSRSGLLADLTNATAANINDIRRAFALQRYQEARAMYGSRYTEYLRYLGVRSSDARLQRPEYLGGGKQTITFTEVLKTGATEDPAEAIGTMKGHGIAAMRSRRFRRFFEEHGHVISLMSVRPRTMYNDGLEKMWSRRAKEDYWQKELEHIGQQEVMAQELWSTTSNLSTPWGYQDRYAEYRHLQSRVSGDFRNTLNFWHMGRIFTAEPVLNASFVSCDPTKRIHAVQNADVLWCMVNNSIQARRMVTRSTVGRVI